MKRCLVFLVILLLSVPAAALAECRSYPLPGNTSQFALVDGAVYVQADWVWPQSTVWAYDPASGTVLMADQLTAEEDASYVLHGNVYALASGDGAMRRILGDSAPDTLTLIPDALLKKGAAPFLTYYTAGSVITFILACGDDCTLCRLDTASGAFQSLALGSSLFAIQPFGESETVIIRAGQNSKEATVFDWNSGSERPLATLPRDAVSIAWDPVGGALYYLSEGALYKYLPEGSEKLMEGLPLWTDQRAFILEGGQLVTLYSDLEEELLVIDLP